MIIDFIDKQKMDISDREAIAKIIKDGFWGKMANYFRYVDRDKAADIIEQAITFNKGFYYKEDGTVLGVSLLSTTDITYMNFGKQVKNSLGFWNTFFLHMGFGFSKPKKSDGLKLEMIAVNPEARGKGVGKKMLAHLNQLAITEGFKRITLEVIESNNRAKTLYEKVGYKDIKYVNTAPFTSKMGFRGYYKMQKDMN